MTHQNTAEAGKAKGNDAKTKKLESQLKQAKRDIAALEEQVSKGAKANSDDDDELDFYKKMNEKKDAQVRRRKKKKTRWCLF